MEHGGVYAVANLRGGAEFGEDWHRAGMLDKKQNVFDDMIAAAEQLIAEKYTDKNHLAVQGGSNGGLLMGAMITQRPDLFRAVVCQVPLLDMLHYQDFQIAKLWIPEYGSAENPEQFKWLYAYSPYHHVKAGTEYPAVLFMTADTDTRVDPMHAKKMAALMQARSQEWHQPRPSNLIKDRNQGRPRRWQASNQADRGVHGSVFVLVLATGSEGVSSPFHNHPNNVWASMFFPDALWNNHLIGPSSPQGIFDANQTLVPGLHNFTYEVYFYPLEGKNPAVQGGDISDLAATSQGEAFCCSMYLPRNQQFN